MPGSCRDSRSQGLWRGGPRTQASTWLRLPQTPCPAVWAEEEAPPAPSSLSRSQEQPHTWFPLPHSLTHRSFQQLLRRSPMLTAQALQASPLTSCCFGTVAPSPPTEHSPPSPSHPNHCCRLLAFVSPTDPSPHPRPLLTSLLGHPPLRTSPLAPS